MKRFLLVRLGRLLTWPVRRQLRRFEADCYRPESVQRDLLERILRDNRDTGFGRDHRFDSIRDFAEYRQHVPVAPYEYVAPYIERVTRGETKALLSEPKVLMFALTSGTTAARKLIPVTRGYLRAYRRGWQMWGVRLFRDHRGRRIAMRPMVQMVGDPDEYRTEAGIPCGNLTGFTAKIQMRLIQRLYAVPPESGKIKDALAKYYVALRFSIGRNVSTFMAANPSTLSQLARILDAEKESLVKDLHDGTLRADLDIPGDVRSSLAPRLKANPGHARELAAISSKLGRLYPKDVWPSDSVVVGTWTGGSMGPYLRKLPEYYGDTPIRDLGLLASEGRMTLPFANSTPSGVLDIWSHVFEFIPESEIDSKTPIALGAHEVEEGKSYYIVPTTSYGLYRYHISDLVRVTGFYGRTPLIEFLGKGHRFANLTGEKLSEHHVTRAIDEVLKTVPLPLGTYSLAPVWDDAAPFYGVFLEASDAADEALVKHFLMRLDRELGGQNIEYAAKRDSGRLGKPRAMLLPDGYWAEWDRQNLAARGGAAEQYKHPCLIGDTATAGELPKQRIVEV
jgi:hypothetical protein